jgi:hypothetical protein
MPAGQQIPQEAPRPANGQSTVHDLFALTDEQILEIESETTESATVGQPFPAVPAQTAETAGAKPSPESPRDAAPEIASQHMRPNAQAGMPAPLEPPPWLAAQMKDPWSGEEAKELWNGVQQARSEAAAYRAAFGTPEDARALKELYPGGVNEARAAANRARLLDDIDRAYFGAAGSTPEQTSAARTQLAAMMLREDPAAFREMIFAGLRALEEAEKGSGAAANAPSLPRMAQIFAANRPDAQSAVGATLGSPVPNLADLATGGASPAPAVIPGPLAASAASAAASFAGARHAVPASVDTSVRDAHVTAYAAFEKAANEDLERSIGATITRTLQHALPNLKERGEEATEGARHGVPLQHRLSLAVRQDVEAALKGDRQLSEQIAQILSARRFDNETRAQVVRLIDDRARQLVPSAAKRVLNDSTQTTLAAHRGNAVRADAVSERREVLPANTDAGRAPLPASPAQRTLASQSRPPAGSAHPGTRRVDYRKLSDEQILDL